MGKNKPGAHEAADFAKNFISGVSRSGVYDAIGDGIVIQDANLKILYQNRAHKALFGEHPGEHCCGAYSHDGKMCEKCPLLKVFHKKAGPFTEELQIKTKKGVSYYSVTASALKDKKGKTAAGIYVFRDITQHKNEDDEVRSDEERYRTIFKAAMDPAYLVDPASLKIVDCNQKASELSGYSVSTLTGMNIKYLYPEEEQDIVSRIFGKAAETGALSGVCGLNQFRDNELRVPIELNLSAVRIRRDDYILCSVRDISKRKHEEERLRYEHERLFNILDSMSDGVYIVSRQYVVEYVNPSFRREFGYVRGRKCYEYFHDRNEACNWCNNKKVISGETVRWEWSSPKNLKTYDMIDTPLQNPDGTISKLTVLRDVTERKKMEDSLRESGEHFMKIFSFSPMGIAIADSEGRLIDINPAFRDMLGYAPEELQRGFMYITHPEDLNEDLKLFHELIEGKRDHYHMDKRYYRKDGALMWAGVHCAAIKDRGGKFKYILSVVEDITERRTVEETLQAAVITDNLTGLFNRRGFFTLAEQQIKLSQRNGKGLSLLVIDVDGLKAINDEFGHKRGDQALIDIAGLLKRTFRESDIAARIGGDEFAVLVTDVSRPGVEDVIINHIAGNLQVFNQEGGRLYGLSLSTGVACYDPGHPCSLEELLDRAAAMMDEDKYGKDPVLSSIPGRTEKRAHGRFIARKECWATLDDSEIVRIKDISLGGVCLKTAAQVAVDSIHTVKIFPSINGEIVSKGIITWSRGGRRRYEAGLKFVETDGDFNKSLEKFIRDYAVTQGRV